MDTLAWIAERKIREAMEQGLFDHLPGRGQPILRDEAADGVPDELRMGFKILKNAGCLPQELELRREMLSLQDLLRSCADAEERKELGRRLALATLHYNILAERNRTNPAFHRYQGRLEAKLGR